MHVKTERGREKTYKRRSEWERDRDRRRGKQRWRGKENIHEKNYFFHQRFHNNVHHSFLVKTVNIVTNLLTIRDRGWDDTTERQTKGQTTPRTNGELIFIFQFACLVSSPGFWLAHFLVFESLRAPPSVRHATGQNMAPSATLPPRVALRRELSCAWNYSCRILLLLFVSLPSSLVFFMLSSPKTFSHLPVV